MTRLQRGVTPPSPGHPLAITGHGDDAGGGNKVVPKNAGAAGHPNVGPYRFRQPSRECARLLPKLAGLAMVGRLLATVLTSCTRSFSYPSKGCERLRPWEAAMSTKTTKTVTVEVKIDLAKCLWALAWFVLILLR